MNKVFILLVAIYVKLVYDKRYKELAQLWASLTQTFNINVGI